MQTPNPSPVSDPVPVTVTPSADGPTAPAAPPADPPRKAHVHDDELPTQRPSKAAMIGSGVIVVIVLCVLTGFLLVVAGVPLPGVAAAEQKKAKQDERPKIDRVPGQPFTVSVPEETRWSLGIRKGGVDQLVTVAAPTEARPLVMSGSTALDPGKIRRIRIRFTPAEVVQIGQLDEYDDEGRTMSREVRSGDHVRKGDLLAVFYSEIVGGMKSNLVDNLSQLKVDQELLDASQRAYDKGAIPLLDLNAAQRNVEHDYAAIGSAEQTLRTWGVPEEDIDALLKEAEELIKQGRKRDRSPEHLKEQLRRWAKVELRATADGIIIERNLSLNDVVVDNTLNLFQITPVDSMQVVANASEDDLPALHQLGTAMRRWVIRTAGAPDGIPGRFSDVGYIIDVNQHSAVVKGYIPNKDLELRSGQLVTATVQLPPPENVVEVPNSALADDGKQVVVFVQTGDQPGTYTMRRVQVVRRYDQTVFVRSRFANGLDEQPLTPAEKEQGLLPRHTLKPGDKVITAGVLEIKRELDDRAAEAEAAKK